MDIRNYLNQTIKVYRKIGQDSHSRPIYDDGTDVKARFVRKQKLVKDNNGKESMCIANALVMPDAAIGMEDKVEYDGINYPVVAFEEGRDTDGSLVYLRAYCGYVAPQWG